MTNGTNANALARVEPATSAALATSSTTYSGLAMVAAPAESLRRHQELQAFVREVMVDGVDYGVIPGTGKKAKPSLFQPGAQKLCEIYGLAWEFQDLETVQDWERGFFLFRKRCQLMSLRYGIYVGNGIGSCNSKEDRYAYRWVNSVPNGVDRATLRSKKTDWGTQYRLPNEDVFSLVNTIEKMAAKRALVHAVLGATRSSGVFTQDVEDLPRDVFGQPEDVRSWDQGREDAEPVKPHAAAQVVTATTAPPATSPPTEVELVAQFEARLFSTKDPKERRKIAAELGRLGTSVLSDPAKAHLREVYKKTTPAKAPADPSLSSAAADAFVDEYAGRDDL